jgi:hypothetical protein
MRLFHPITGQPSRRTVGGALVVGILLGLLGNRVLPSQLASQTSRALSDERAERLASDERLTARVDSLRQDLDSMTLELRAMRGEVRSILAIVSRSP